MMFFYKLSSVWDEIEIKSKLMGEWHSLMAWLIFACFHDKARIQFVNGEKSVKKSQIEIRELNNGLIKNLRLEGYEDMFEEFEKDNLIE